MEMTNDTNDNYIKQHHTTSNPDIQSHPHLYLSKTNFQHSPNPITTILVPINKKWREPHGTRHPYLFTKLLDKNNIKEVLEKFNFNH